MNPEKAGVKLFQQIHKPWIGNIIKPSSKRYCMEKLGRKGHNLWKANKCWQYSKCQDCKVKILYDYVS